MHKRLVRGAQFSGSPLRDDHALGHEINFDHHLQRLGHVVRDDDGSGAEGVVQAPDQLADDAHGDRIQAGERLVVKDQHGVERGSARQRHAPRHAAREIRGHEPVRPAQAHRLQLHQHQIVDQLVRQIGVLAHLESDVVVARHVGKQRPELEQHPHPAAQRVQFFVMQPGNHLAVDAHFARAGAQRAADHTQQRGLAAAGQAHDRHHLAAADGKIDALEDLAAVVGEVYVIDFDQVVCCRLRRHGMASAIGAKRAFYQTDAVPRLHGPRRRRQSQ